MTSTTLWRPTGPEELELVRAAGWRRWPPRLPDQTILEYWIPAPELADLNDNLVGEIEVAHEFR